MTYSIEDLLPLAKRLYDDDESTYAFGSAARPEWDALWDSRKGKYLDRAREYVQLVSRKEETCMPYPSKDFPAKLRTYVCDGTHGLTHTRELTFYDADDTQVELSVEFCADEVCAKLIRTACQHASNSWHYTPDYQPAEPGDLDGEGNSALLCDFCRKDGT